MSALTFLIFVGFFIIFYLALLFFIMSSGSTYVKFCSSQGFVLALAKILRLPVRLFKKISPQNSFHLWQIEKNPPDWLTGEIVELKNSVTWDDRAKFWFLLLRSGTYYTTKKIGRTFLPRLIAFGFKAVLRMFKRFLKERNLFLKTFKENPIRAYLLWAGNLSGYVINWISNSIYRDQFIQVTKEAGYPIGYYYGKKFSQLKFFKESNLDPITKATQMIMYIYVVFGLAGWERIIYPSNEPEVIVNPKESIISFCGNPYRCPHRGMKDPSICQAFVSWEDGLVRGVNKNLKSYVSKRLAAGETSCDVSIEYRSNSHYKNQ
ncbi:MAG: hypothetical protein ACTSR3_07025 [Candidatus Helarchaeota archaeon]